MRRDTWHAFAVQQKVGRLLTHSRLPEQSPLGDMNQGAPAKSSHPESLAQSAR